MQPVGAGADLERGAGSHIELDRSGRCALKGNQVVLNALNLNVSGHGIRGKHHFNVIEIVAEHILDHIVRRTKLI